MVVTKNDYVRLVSHLTMLDLKLKYDQNRDCLILQSSQMPDLDIPLQPPKYDPALVKSVTQVSIFFDRFFYHF